MVYGVLAEEAVDKSGEIFDYVSSKPLFEEWSGDFEKRTTEAGQEVSKGNLRAMHEGIAAGKFTQMVYDDEAKKIIVAAHVVDKNEWEKCEKGVYTGFSIGGKYEKQWMDEALKKIRYTARPAEGSIVDNACMYGATFTAVKADGAQELRKFVGALPVVKDAAAVAAQADRAIASIRELIAGLALLEGEPSSWSLADLANALGNVMGVKYMVTTDAIQDGATVTVSTVTLEAAAPAGDLKKSDEAKPAAPVVADPIAAATAVMPGKAIDAGELLKGINDSFGKTLGDLQETLTKHVDTQIQAVKDGIPETVGKAVGDAVKTATDALQAELAKVAQRLEDVEATPAAIGRPVHRADKNIGSGPGQSGGTLTEDVAQKFLTDAKASGKFSATEIEKLTLHAAACLMR